MTGIGALAGFFCVNVARAEGGAGVWWLGWEWFTTVSATVGWLCRAAVLMAEQLSPQAGHAVRAWVAGDGPAAAQQSLEAFRPCAFGVSEDGVRYELAVAPMHTPPLGVGVSA